MGDALVTSSPISDPQRRTEFKLAIQAALPDLFTAVRATIGSGRLPDEGHSLRHQQVAVLGPNAAEQLGIGRLDRLPAIRIGDDVFLVIGILDTVERQHDLLSAVIIPEGTAEHLYHLRSPETVVIQTEVGAASTIGSQAPLALRPDNPAGLKVVSPEEPQRVRDAVQSDLNLLFLVLGGVSLLVGAIAIANVTVVSVMERIGESAYDERSAPSVDTSRPSSSSKAQPWAASEASSVPASA